MKECLIVGAGSSKAKAVEYPGIFSISANLHHPNANAIFAQDDPILDRILREEADGFRTQPVFTTPQKYKKYKDHFRCYEFNYRLFHNCSSLSSGLNAIVLAQFFNFERIILCGFNFDEKEANYNELFKIISHESEIEYTFK